MKTFLSLILSTLALSAQTVVVDLVYTGTPAPTKYAIYSGTGTNRVKILDNIPGTSKWAGVPLTNGTLYTLSAVATVTLGTQTFDVTSNILPPILVVLPLVNFH